MSLAGRLLRLHEQLYERSDGRIGHRMIGVPTLLLLRTIGRRTGATRIVEPADPDYDHLWRIVNENNRDRYSAYQKQTARGIPVVVIAPT